MPVLSFELEIDKTAIFWHRDTVKVLVLPLSTGRYPH